MGSEQARRGQASQSPASLSGARSNCPRRLSLFMSRRSPTPVGLRIDASERGHNMRFDRIVCSLTVVLQRSHVGVPPLCLCPRHLTTTCLAHVVRGMQSSRVVRCKSRSSGF